MTLEFIRPAIFYWAGLPAWNYIQQLWVNTGCSPEDRPEAIDDREGWREKVYDDDDDIQPTFTKKRKHLFFSWKLIFPLILIMLYYRCVYIWNIYLCRGLCACVCACVCVCVCAFISSVQSLEAIKRTYEEW